MTTSDEPSPKAAYTETIRNLTFTLLRLITPIDHRVIFSGTGPTNNISNDPGQVGLWSAGCKITVFALRVING